MRLLRRHYKLSTERNWHSQGSGPLGSDPIGPRSAYSVMPYRGARAWNGLFVNHETMNSSEIAKRHTFFRNMHLKCEKVVYMNKSRPK